MVDNVQELSLLIGTTSYSVALSSTHRNSKRGSGMKFVVAERLNVALLCMPGFG